MSELVAERVGPVFSGQVRVSAKRALGPRVVALTLEARGDETLPDWEPGAHIDIRLGGDLVRQYSLCGVLGEQSWTVAVLREEDSRGGSSYLHERVDVGDVLRVSEPRNNFALRAASRYLFIAGGIGITPIVPMIAAVSARGEEWRLVYTVRGADGHLFRDELESFGGAVTVHRSDLAGRLALESVLERHELDRLVYACGPQGMMDEIETVTSQWPSGSVQTERFLAAEIDTSADQEFEIELAQRGERLLVPADRSALSVLLERGIDVLTSCGEGICGSCEVSVLAGEIDHRDSVLSASERAAQDTMMVCVSRSRSGCPLRLDL